MNGVGGSGSAARLAVCGGRAFSVGERLPWRL